MHINAEGIVFRQVKIAGGRKMLHLFTKKYGKISAGTSISEKSRTKSALALQLFTYGNYEIYKSKEYYNINSGEVKKTYYKIAEDVIVIPALKNFKVTISKELGCHSGLGFGFFRHTAACTNLPIFLCKQMNHFSASANFHLSEYDSF